MAVPARPSTAPPAPPPHRTGAFREVGTVRHANIHAQRYRLRGSGRITGEVDVDEAELDGIVSVSGRLTADRLEVKGTLEVGGDVTVRGTVRLRGTGRFLGGLTAGGLTTDGLVRISQGARVTGPLSAKGTLEIGGDAVATLFSSEGRVAIAGALRASEVDTVFESESTLGPVEAAIVSLRPRQLVPLPIEVPVLNPRAFLHVDRIEGERVDLEGVEVDYVKASQIVLGRHCHVTRIDGTIARKDPTSYVGYESRTPPPHGLSR